MTRKQAEELTDLIKEIARSAAFHSESISTDCYDLIDKLVEIFPEEVV